VGLGASGWANAYYSAAVQAGTRSWQAFFFGSLDWSNFITVDKSPAFLWPMELSARHRAPAGHSGPLTLGAAPAAGLSDSGNRGDTRHRRPPQGHAAPGSAVLAASVIVVVVLAAMPAKSVTGDVAVTVENFKIVMPTTLRPGRHTFALTNGGSAPHELLLFRTDLAANALPIGPEATSSKTRR